MNEMSELNEEKKFTNWKQLHFVRSKQKKKNGVNDKIPFSNKCLAHKTQKYNYLIFDLTLVLFTLYNELHTQNRSNFSL